MDICALLDLFLYGKVPASFSAISDVTSPCRENSSREIRSRYVKLPWKQNFWTSTKWGPAKMTGKNDMLDFPTRDCTQVQNYSLYFSSSFGNANGRLFQERLLRPRNFATWGHDVALLSIALGSKSPLLAWIAQTGQGTRLGRYSTNHRSLARQVSNLRLR